MYDEQYGYEQEKTPDSDFVYKDSEGLWYKLVKGSDLHPEAEDELVKDYNIGDPTAKQKADWFDMFEPDAAIDGYIVEDGVKYPNYVSKSEYITKTYFDMDDDGVKELVPVSDVQKKFYDRGVQQMDTQEIEAFSTFVSRYNAESFKQGIYKGETPEGEIYNENLKSKYMGEDAHSAFKEKYRPARFVGFLEDNPELYLDVSRAAEETGMDPKMIYMTVMQEGLVDVIRGRTNVYDEGQYIDAYGQIGLEAATVEEGRMMDLGYIEGSLNLKYDTYYDHDTDQTVKRTGQNEDFMSYNLSAITQRDAIRATGGLLRLNKDYLNHGNYYDHDGNKDTPAIYVEGFKDLGIDFDALPEEAQMFWMYASINAGHNDAKMLLKNYGKIPWENQDFLDRFNPSKPHWREEKEFKHHMAYLEKKIYDYSFSDGHPKEMHYSAENYKTEKYSKFHKWMYNTLRTTMGYEVMNQVNPWENTKIDVDKEVFNLLK